MKNYICTFASSNLSYATERLKKQISEIGFFDGLFIFDENNIDGHFKRVLKGKSKETVRGYGYWSWKPCIIKMSLDKIDEGDMLLYVDAGCHINKKGKKRLFKYYDLLNKSKSGIMVFQKPNDSINYLSPLGKKIIKNYFMEYNWSKGDLLDYFNVRNNTKVTQTPQVVANAIFIKKTPKTYDFVNKWLNVFYEHLNLIDETPSVSENLTPAFKQSRYDQSILSILSKLNDVTILQSTEIEHLPALVNNNPILAVRDINGRMKYGKLDIYRFTRIIKYPFHSFYFFFKMRKIQLIKL